MIPPIAFAASASCQNRSSNPRPKQFYTFVCMALFAVLALATPEFIGGRKGQEQPGRRHGNRQYPSLHASLHGDAGSQLP
ncbi:hypothetical protein DFH08DRAFT_904546, partial [Mycena albidolilacea]